MKYYLLLLLCLFNIPINANNILLYDNLNCGNNLNLGISESFNDDLYKLFFYDLSNTKNNLILGDYS